ncbi:MAG: hypothetical protein PF517_08920 [Salinivirgaceae bacterium]|jgi:hypothetical protein|nr:hypothetical protein [Salinivirgaceae bacterium]
MKSLSKIILLVTIVIFSSNVKAQFLPPAYEPLLNEIVENFSEIRGTTSLTEGKNSLRLLGQEKIIIKMKHKRSVKTLTFIKKKDEEGQKYWVAANKLSTDMVNKYEDDLTKVWDTMLELSREQAKQ